jgi:hypothetical protein
MNENTKNILRNIYWKNHLNNYKNCYDYSIGELDFNKVAELIFSLISQGYKLKLEL